MIKTNWETDILIKRLEAVMRRKKPEIYFTEHKLTPNNRGYYNIWYTVSIVYKGQVFKIWHPENMKLCRKSKNYFWVARNAEEVLTKLFKITNIPQLDVFSTKSRFDDLRVVRI